MTVPAVVAQDLVVQRMAGIECAAEGDVPVAVGPAPLSLHRDVSLGALGLAQEAARQRIALDPAGLRIERHRLTFHQVVDRFLVDASSDHIGPLERLVADCRGIEHQARLLALAVPVCAGGALAVIAATHLGNHLVVRHPDRVGAVAAPVPQVEEVARPPLCPEHFLGAQAGPVVDVAAGAGQRLADLLLLQLAAQVGVRLHGVLAGLVGKSQDAIAHRDVAAVARELRHAAVVQHHRHPILMHAVRLRARRGPPLDDPPTALIDQHVVEQTRPVGRPAVVDEDFLGVVGRAHLQRHGERLGDADVALWIVSHHAAAMREPRQQHAADQQQDGQRDCQALSV